jgi:hypothetical protein
MTKFIVVIAIELLKLESCCSSRVHCDRAKSAIARHTCSERHVLNAIANSAAVARFSLIFPAETTKTS